VIGRVPLSTISGLIPSALSLARFLLSDQRNSIYLCLINSFSKLNLSISPSENKAFSVAYP